MSLRTLLQGAALCAALAAPAAADPFFEDGLCAFVVASRPSVPEARAYIYENGWDGAAGVFLSENGWYAIAVDLVSTDSAAELLEARKRSGLYPGDAYCSTGQSYLREVAWRADGAKNTPDSARPVVTELWGEFDARPMTETEKRFLQGALALSGHYNGLIDGVWGNGSQGALERYTLQEFDTAKPANAHAAFLTSVTLDAWIAEGWEAQYISHLDISMMLPMAGLSLSEREGAYEFWEHDTKALGVFFNDLRGYELEGLHEAFISDRARGRAPYRLRERDRWVTSASGRDGNVYVRSDLIAGTWSTVAVVAGAELAGEMALVSASIAPGRPRAIVPDTNGVLARYAGELAATFAKDRDAPPGDYAGLPATGSGGPAPDDTPKAAGSSGSAFYVTRDGVAVTNAHVIAGCSVLSIDGQPAEILSVSGAFDLAAIKLSAPGETAPLHFAPDDASLNADITVAGYPLNGILGGLNVSRGAVSSMKGLRGDETTMQISAAVQPGNSGGPAIDRTGGVVGVVVSKLDTLALADATGDIAQNVNFAIRGSLAKVFLSSNGIAYEERTAADPISPEKAAELLQASTGLVECGG